MQLECFFRFSLSPRGDGNAMLVCKLDLLNDFLYPREGTETAQPCRCTRTHKIFFIPARGRKPCLYTRVSARCRFSLSPRGDGNFYIKSVATCALRFSLSPRGDGNAQFSSTNVRVRIFFIPARGRKQRGGPARVIKSGFSLSPRGDGNRSMISLAFMSSISDFLYPREGTETVARPVCSGGRSIFFIPARGRKHMWPLKRLSPPVILFIPARGRKLEFAQAEEHHYRFSLSPRGDGNRKSHIAELTLRMIFFIPARGRKQLSDNLG